MPRDINTKALRQPPGRRAIRYFDPLWQELMVFSAGDGQVPVSPESDYSFCRSGEQFSSETDAYSLSLSGCTDTRPALAPLAHNNHIGPLPVHTGVLWDLVPSTH